MNEYLSIGLASFPENNVHTDVSEMLLVYNKVSRSFDG